MDRHISIYLMLRSVRRFHRGCSAELLLHNTETTYAFTSLETFTCRYLILVVDLSPDKDEGCLVFPCYIAAISTVSDLKNASPLFPCLCTDDDSHSNTPCRDRERAKERDRRDVLFYMALIHTIPLHVSCFTLLCYCLFTEIPVLISIPYGSLQSGNAAGVVALLNP